MKKMKWIIIALILVITGLWISANTFIPKPFGYFSFRSAVIQYSGVVASIFMSICMVLALRLEQVDKRLGGLDKTYRLHKLMGITSFGFAILHWWFASGTKWMVGWGWLEKPVRKARAPIEDSLQLFFQSQMGLAEKLGEIGFYALVAILLIALIKKIPYNFFRYTHRLISPLYLFIVFHTIIFTKFCYWTQPIGIVLAVFLFLGTIAAIIDMTGGIGKKKRVAGTITDLEHISEFNVMHVTARLSEKWQGHDAGQFAFVTSKKSEGAHPYTIASAWDKNTLEVSFVIKGLGGWTNQLSSWLKVDMPVTIEGPYGEFTFKDKCAQQIWVGAGVGITPFIAKMLERAKEQDPKPATLFYCTKTIHPPKLAQLQQIAAEAKVALHVFNASNDEFLNGEKLCLLVPDWQQASLWFCGPAAFGSSLEESLIKQGFSASRFHQELFEFR